LHAVRACCVSALPWRRHKFFKSQFFCSTFWRDWRALE
jgi:hypothetical protein